jgi:hypothetical protein
MRLLQAGETLMINPVIITQLFSNFSGHGGQAILYPFRYALSFGWGRERQP